MVARDEKRVVYDNVARKKSWRHSNEPSQTSSKAGLQKIMLSIWWDFKDVIYELLLSCEIIDSTVCYSQLTKLDQTIRTERPELANRKGVFQHDNAKPDTSLTTHKKLFNLS